MRINKKRIHNVEKVLTGFNKNEKVIIMLDDIERYKTKLVQIGFSNSLKTGERILPSVVGRVTEYNANGRYEKLKDLPKEIFYVSRTVDIRDWHGNYHLVSQSIPYEQYQRRLIEAFFQELTIVKDSENNKIIVSDIIEVTTENKPLVKHTVNLFLELFGECLIVDDELFSRKRTPIMRVNWNILPKGGIPWDSLEEHLIKLLERHHVDNEKDSLKRFEYINGFGPDFIATGHGGFNDYVVFGFTNKNLYVLENAFAGNATYIFNKDWEELSQLTKAEILTERLQKHRLIHRRNWRRNIGDILISGTE